MTWLQTNRPPGPHFTQFIIQTIGCFCNQVCNSVLFLLFHCVLKISESQISASVSRSSFTRKPKWPFPPSVGVGVCNLFFFSFLRLPPLVFFTNKNTLICLAGNRLVIQRYWKSRDKWPGRRSVTVAPQLCGQWLRAERQPCFSLSPRTKLEHRDTSWYRC